ncbi:MAG TPA: multidrug effflux MFS transporter [Steroidobacteraceae bacterium]|nr:multidrug effflux MFS transporter [Steroidobacteraceae bacterium]
MKPRFLRNAITLGLLSAIGPFAIDMYLPALPAISRSLHAAGGTVQMTLTVFFIALSIGQPVCGALADRFGRKPPLYGGLTLFAVATVGCATAPGLPALIVFRFLQGLGACAGIVIPRAIVRDLHRGVEATRLMSLIMLVFSVSPILAPLTGSFVIQHGGWRAIFWTVLAAALAGLAIAATLRETRTHAQRTQGGLSAALAAYGVLLRDPYFLGLSLTGTFGLAGFFVYLSNSPFVLIEHYHLSPRLYSVLFSVNAAAFFATAQLNAWLAERIGLRALVRRAASGYALAMVALFAVFASGVDRLELLATLLFIGYGFLGLVLPTAAVLAFEEHGAIAGTASAMLGTVQFAAGSSVMLLVSSFSNGTPLPMVAGIAGCASLAWLFAQVTLRRSSEPRGEAAAE